MTDPQSLANEVGDTLRAAERAAGNGNLGQTLVELGKLHTQLGQVYLAYNAAATKAGDDPLEWGPIAGNDQARGGAHTNSGGTPKGEPSKA